MLFSDMHNYMEQQRRQENTGFLQLWLPTTTEKPSNNQVLFNCLILESSFEHFIRSGSCTLPRQIAYSKQFSSNLMQNESSGDEKDGAINNHHKLNETNMSDNNNVNRDEIGDGGTSDAPWTGGPPVPGSQSFLRGRGRGRPKLIGDELDAELVEWMVVVSQF